MEPGVLFHVAAGGLGLVSGAAALIARKGERVHRMAGAVFFAAMLTTAASAVILALLKDELTNAIAGALTTYFITTSWLTVKRPERSVGLADVFAMVFAAAGSAAAFYLAYDSVRTGTALLGGLPFYIFSGVAALCALLDLSVILRRGVAGRQRIARHLWRMCLGFFIAVASVFPGQLQFFPEAVQNIEPIIVLFIPAFSVLAVMFFWLGRVLFTRAFV
ncbi:MAG: hypothetical protein DCF16_03600 [Alphaproteobacteria bacterium]|nr:MAG: hypothetical protein DCF16_03600 [Alphaproteobacteria bacterium]